MGVTLKPEIKHSILWKAHEGSQKSFLACPITEILYSGTRGPGKSDAMLMKFAKYIGRYGAAWRGVIFAPKYKNLDEIKAKGKKWFFMAFGKRCRFLESADSYKFVWDTGEELLLRHIDKEDDYWNYHGHEYPFIGWEELTKWRDNTLYEMMRSVNRSSESGMPRFYISTTNPYGIGHGWVKQYWIDPYPDKCPTGVMIEAKKMVSKPNESGIVVRTEQTVRRVRFDGDLLENKILLAADPEYLTRLESIENEDLRMAWRFGSWDVNVGSFFDGILIPKRHKIAPFIPPITWRRWRALDWGSSKPYSVGWYAMNEDKEIFRYRELYGMLGKPDVGTRLPASEVAAQIKAMEKMERKAGCRFTNNPADDSIFDFHGHEQTISELFARSPNNINWVKAQKNKVRRIQGWQIIIECLYHDQIKITSDCKQFWRTMPLQMVSDTDAEDIDTDGEDHIADEFRYSVVSRHMPKSKPEKSKAPKPGTYEHLLQLGI